MSYQRLFQNIFLLEKITDYPERPHDNSVPPNLRQEPVTSKRVLNIDQERSVVAALSFLASHTDDPYKVSALCIEEHASGHGITVNIAANAGDSLLLKAGLETLAEVIEKEALSSSPQVNEEDLLEKVISFNRNRLLCRISSKHARKKKMFNQLPFLPKLPETVKEQCFRRALADASIAKIRNEAETAASLFSRLESTKRNDFIKIDSLLLQILRKLRDIENICDFEQMFGTDPGPRERLRKLTRYFVLVPRVLKFARRFSIFRKIDVVVVKVKSQDMLQSTKVNAERSNGKGILDIFGTKQQELTGKAAHFLNQRFGSRLEMMKNDTQAYSKSKRPMHAEIQLLFHYEQPSQRNLQGRYKPRVICSSKNACFLCDLFIRLHGEFFVPRTHGKLYPRWDLPDLTRISAGKKRLSKLFRIYDDFNKHIEDLIWQNIAAKKLRMTNPNESMIFSVPSLTASVVSTQLGRSQEEDDLLSNLLNPPKQSQLKAQLIEQDESAESESDKINTKEYRALVLSNLQTSVTPDLTSDDSFSSDPSILSSSESMSHQSLESVKSLTGSNRANHSDSIDLELNQQLELYLSRDKSCVRLCSPRIHATLDFEEVWSEIPKAGASLAQTSKLQLYYKVTATWIKDKGKAVSPNWQEKAEIDLDDSWYALEIGHRLLAQKGGVALRKCADLLLIHATAYQTIED